MNIRKSLALVVLFVALLLLPTAGRYATFYRPAVERPGLVRPDMAQITIPTPPAADFRDETVSAGTGVVVVDMAHKNRLEQPELNVLAGRLAARGHQLQVWTGGDLAVELRQASALLVATPLSSYDEKESAAVRRFVESGGRLLLMGDPTRYDYLTDEWGWITGIESDARHLNSLGALFGITFVDDYLYNVTDNEGNFRNIKLTDLSGGLTADLEMVVFYAAHSLAAADEAAVIRADSDTWSSATDRAGGLVVAAQAAEGRVLALGDLTFMVEPYHTVRDNSQFIARIADFLTGAERRYDLQDFPLFFGDRVALAFTNNPELGAGQLQQVDELQEFFDQHDRTLTLVEQPAADLDAFYAGLYSQSDPVTELLTLYNITLTITSTLSTEEVVTDSLELDAEPAGEDDQGTSAEKEQPAEGQVTIAGLGSYDMSGISLLLLHEGDGNKTLVALAASQEGLGAVLGRLPGGELLDCVTAGAVTLCPTGVGDEEIELDWRPQEAEEPADEGDQEDDQPLPEGVQGDVEYGETVAGDLGEGEEHLWRLSGTAGDVVTIRAETENEMLDLVLELEDEDGEVLASADDNTSGAEEIQDYELPTSGDYFIRVSDFWEAGGDYTLTLELADGDEQPAGQAIEFGETVEAELATDEVAVWTFSGSANQAITIIVQPSSEGDLILTLQDANGDTLVSVDDAFSGEAERIEGQLPADGDYRIQIEEWYGEAISYTLTLEEGGEGPVLGGRGILVVSADEGEPLLDGRTSAEEIVAILSEYDVTLWTLSADGPIELEDMLDFKLVIWTSGDYQGDEAQFAPYLYLSEGRPLFWTGVALGLLAVGETAPLRDLEVAEGETQLTDGLTAGEVIELAGEIDAVVFEYEEDEESGTIPVLLRGPASDVAGDMIAAGVQEDGLDQLQLLLVGFPIYLMPEWAQTQLVLNAVAWFGIEPLP